jgi:RNA recognition motif-containing protein
MTKKLFVGGLSWGTKDEQLKAAFEKYGTVAEAKVILDMDTGRSRGFGFVTFPEDTAGTRAIQEMDGADLDGRTVRVNEAQERSRTSRDPVGGRPPGGGGGYRGSSGGGGAGGGRGEGRPAFRSEDRPAGNAGGKRRGGRGGEGKGEDRFARRRNSQGGGGRPNRGGDYGGSDGYGSGYGEDE